MGFKLIYQGSWNLDYQVGLDLQLVYDDCGTFIYQNFLSSSLSFGASSSFFKNPLNSKDSIFLDRKVFLKNPKILVWKFSLHPVYQD